MASHAVVLSYSWKDRETAEFSALREDLSILDRRPWYDQEPRNDPQWWAEVLARIRACDLFVAAVTRASLASSACRSELQYASACRRRLLPVAIQDLTGCALPDVLRPIQIVDYHDCTSDVRSASRCTARLSQLLSVVEATEQLPLPVPPPREPPLPESYGGTLSRLVSSARLTEADQNAILEEVKRLLSADPGERHTLLGLVDSVLERKDVGWQVHSELAAIANRLREQDTPAAFPAPPWDTVSASTAPPPAGRVESRTYWAPGAGLPTIVEALTRFFDQQGMESTVRRESDGGYLVQSTSVKRQTRFTGAGASQSTRLSPRGDNVVVTVFGQQWADKAASLTGGVAATIMTQGLALPLVVPSMIGAVRQSSLPRRTFEFLAEAFGRS